MKDKNYILRRADGLYVMKREDGSLGFTNKANATHFDTKRELKDAIKKLRKHHYEVEPIDMFAKAAEIVT